MSLVNVTNIQVHNNPAPFTSPFSLTITFECLQDIAGELDWKLIYVGSSEDESYDQELESFSMGPLNYGVMQFELEAEGPDPKRIPPGELLGVTALLLTTSYNGKEFFRIGYYVYNDYTDQELIEMPPEKVKIDAVTRNILVDKPRITRFDIKWKEDPVDLMESSKILSGSEAMLANPASQSQYSQASIFKPSQSEAISGLFNEKYGDESNNPFITNSTGSGEPIEGYNPF